MYHMYHLFSWVVMGSTGQVLPVCAKTISSWVKKFSLLLKHMALGSPSGVGASAALVAGVSVGSIL